MHHCSMKDMAERLGICDDTLRARYSEQIKMWRAEGKADLLSEQWKIMKKGSSDMAKWLGRAILKQNESADLLEEQKATLTNFTEAIDRARESDLDSAS